MSDWSAACMEGLLNDRLDTLPQSASVKVAVSIHGMPWDQFPNEVWLKLSPPYLGPLLEDVKKLVSSYNFSKTEVVKCQEFDLDGTRTIYNEVLTGPRYRHYVADSLCQAIDSILSQSKQLQARKKTI